jgi:hypothetical protein
MSSDAVVEGLANWPARADEDRHERRLATAVAVVAGAERDIDLLWREAVASSDSDMCERLAELSHALRRAARSLDGTTRGIG